MAKSSTAAIVVLIFIIGVPPLVTFSPFDCSPLSSVYPLCSESDFLIRIEAAFSTS
jgi:hypothetical protein